MNKPLVNAVSDWPVEEVREGLVGVPPLERAEPDHLSKEPSPKDQTLKELFPCQHQWRHLETKMRIYSVNGQPGYQRRDVFHCALCRELVMDILHEPCGAEAPWWYLEE
jgi:hypothetical protein